MVSNVKRLFDIFVALALIIVLFPVLLVTGILVFIKLGRPVFFVQSRPGYGEKLFGIIKFRTMREAIDTEGEILPDIARLGRFGRFLRSTSIDELPELINVLRGEMSLVGPRPLLVEYLPYYSEEQRRRHSVLPGITGWAQINGRNTLSWEEKFLLDVWYVDHKSFALDLKILWRTFFYTISRRGISAVGHVTMPPFLDHRDSPSKENRRGDA